MYTRNTKMYNILEYEKHKLRPIWNEKIVIRKIINIIKSESWKVITYKYNNL